MMKIHQFVFYCVFNKEVGSHHLIQLPELGLEQGERSSPGKTSLLPRTLWDAASQFRRIAGMPHSTAECSPARDLRGKPWPAAPSPPGMEDLDASDDCAKSLSLPRLLKFPSTQHKQETCSKSPGGANSTLPAEGGRISSWGWRWGGGRGSSKVSTGPLNHPCLFFPNPERVKRRRKEGHAALGKIEEGEVEMSR